MKQTRAGYTLVKKNQDVALRGAAQQQTTKILRSMLYENPTPATLSGYGGATTAPALVQGDRNPQTGMQLAAWEIHNRSSAAMSVGIGFRWANRFWQTYDWDDGTTATRETGYQSRTATTLFGNITTPANEDGLLIVAEEPFDWVSVNVTTASADATNPAADIDYWGPSNAWITNTTNMALVDSMTVSGAELGTGEALLCWYPPHDWSPVQAGDTLDVTYGIEPGKYALLWRWGTIPDATDPVFTGIEIGSMIFSGEELADNGLWENEVTDYQDLRADGVVALIETLTAVGSMIAFQVKAAG